MNIRKISSILLASALSVCMLAGCGGAASSGNSGNGTGSSASGDAAGQETAGHEAAGQGSSSAPAGAETAAADPASDADLTEFDVVLDWYPNAVHTFLYEAQDKGYFAEEGLKVNIINPAETVDAMTFVAAGRAQIGFSYPVDTVNAVAAQNMPVRAIGAVVQEELSCMASLAETDITGDMGSLIGKKVGHSGPAVEEAIIRTVMKNAGLSDDDVEVLNVGFDLTTSLTTKNTDMVVGTFINDEIVTMRNAGYDVNVWKYEDYGIPQMYGLVLIANRDAYAADPALYQGFLRACRKGFADMKADEDQALATIMADMNSDDNPLDEVQQRESYEILLPMMEKEDRPFLSMQESDWQAVIDWMAQSGLIEEKCDAADVYIAE
ncbi:MAG: ABC transporter substrate-binding protein [Lachnospiraceae bacterium]|nr:ABC transporter substrate-binding protein [Lachnospiraceae bacterium]